MLSQPLNEGRRNDILVLLREDYSRNYFKDCNYGKTYEEVDRELTLLEEAALKRIWNRQYGHLANKLQAIPTQLLSSKSFSIKVEEVNNLVLYLAGEHGYLVGSTEGIDVVITQAEFNREFCEHQCIANLLVKFREDRNIFTSKAKVILKGVSTTGKLEKIWPEISPLVAKVYGQGNSRVQLPSVPVASLNADLGYT